jgi:hypothetical protein
VPRKWGTLPWQGTLARHTYTHTGELEFQLFSSAVTIQHMSGTCVLICCRAEAILMHMLQEAVQLQVPPGAPRDPDRMWWQPTSFSPLPGLGVMDINSSITFGANFSVLQLFGYHNNCGIIHNHEVMICHSPCQKFVCVACMFSSKDYLRERLRAHAGQVKHNKKYNCQHCNKEFHGTTLLQIHMCARAHTQVNFLSCL